MNYTCAKCGWQGESTWSDEEAVAEAAENFGSHLDDNPAVVCDDCYQAMTAALPIAEYLSRETE